MVKYMSFYLINYLRLKFVDSVVGIDFIYDLSLNRMIEISCRVLGSWRSGWSVCSRDSKASRDDHSQGELGVCLTCRNRLKGALSLHRERARGEDTIYHRRGIESGTRKHCNLY